jgi:hypothetical protein
MPPKNSEEITFFAWEYILAQQLHVLEEWEKGSADYALGELSEYGIEMGRNSWFDYGGLGKYPEHKVSFWKERLTKARLDGLVKGEKVVAIR